MQDNQAHFKMGSTELFTVDQAIRHLTNTAPDKVIISYPTPELEYTDYTCTHIDKLTRAAASLFPQALKKSVKHGNAQEAAVVGITGPSNLEYYITFLALLPLGVTPLVLSPRLADQGFANLLRESNCRTVLASNQLCSVLERVRFEFDMSALEIIPMASIEALVDHPGHEGFVFRQMDISSPSKSPDLLMHTGGTTSLPKLVPLCTSYWITLTQRIIGRVNLPDTLSTLPSIPQPRARIADSIIGGGDEARSHECTEADYRGDGAGWSRQVGSVRARYRSVHAQNPDRSSRGY